MTSNKGASVVIIGGGVTGLSAGWWLARDGIEVLVLDKGIVGWEASGRNGGGATHFGSPLFHEEQRLWPQMDDLLGYPTEYQRERIILALNERQHEIYQLSVDKIRRKGYGVTDLDGKCLREAVPFVGDNVRGAWLVHVGGHANPQRTVQAYAWALQDLGGRILQHTRVLDFTSTGGRVAEVHTDRGRFHADVVVAAAGPQTAGLMTKLGINVPLSTSRAEMIATEPLDTLMARGGVDGNGLFGRQTLRGNLIYGGGSHEWIDAGDGAIRMAQPSTPLICNIAKRLCELFPKAGHVRMIRSWSGIVEVTPDLRPILHRLEHPSNVVLATMSSFGFGLSPASGRAIRDLVVDGVCSFANLDKLKLDRFARLEPDWRERRGWFSSGPECGGN
ncbi:NAD(P)/FAD-dependent oxidoreductase [Bradyrhizobium sp. BR 1433]|uniref:NAD(P)/FAD-dependent oxidoreductase n=1 Tax=Bradyrhizobium sp. BR 1433 TaxID=3447967 RepID=UPI003EE51D97